MCLLSKRYKSEVINIKRERLKVLSADVFSLVLTSGTARSAYTPLLPNMLDRTNFEMSAGASLASVNYVGYFCGAIIVSMISDLRIKDRIYRSENE